MMERPNSRCQLLGPVLKGRNNFSHLVQLNLPLSSSSFVASPPEDNKGVLTGLSLSGGSDWPLSPLLRLPLPNSIPPPLLGNGARFW